MGRLDSIAAKAGGASSRLVAIPVQAKTHQPQRTQGTQRNHGDLIQSSPKEMERFRRALLAWYDRNRRDLPWRGTRDPYAIWISEIMLQQTRVAAVLEHYRIFLERFPNVVALAKASEDAVLAAWSGLGYYRRARMLHQCAREIVQRQRGRFPENSAALEKLPGIGRYTAAAVASIAFAEPVAVVDGNVERVLQRITGSNFTARQCWERAEEMLSKARPGDFNQAMMELGATVCLPREPRCVECPVRQWCVTQGEAPRAKASPRQNKRQIWCALERRDGQVRLVKRPGKASLMAGMWELPQWAELPHASASQAHWRTFQHSITVTNYTVHVLRDWRRRGGVRAARGKWVAIGKISQLPITGLTRKILKAGGII
jgi:A/G-specific adenine glycosylase